MKRVRDRKYAVQAVLDKKTWLELAVVIESMRTIKNDPFYSQSQFIREMIKIEHGQIQEKLQNNSKN